MIIIGLETHVEINTKHKLFCECLCSKSGKINEFTCDICLGFPGSLPLLNFEAIQKGLKFINLIKGTVNKQLIFSRKHYYYYDSPKSFQLTQDDIDAIGHNGAIKLFDFKNKVFTQSIVKFSKVLLEENPGAQVGNSIDFNRAGAPLLEIVTQPIFHDKETVLLYLQNLRFLLLKENITSENLNFKSDVNISYNNGKRVELKNLGSIEEIGESIDAETLRQKTETVLDQEVRNYDSVLKVTTYSRKKETHDQYLFLREPDLPIINLTESNEFIIKNKRVEDSKILFDVYYKKYDKNLLQLFPIFIQKFPDINKQVIFSANLDDNTRFFLENSNSISSLQLSIIIQELKYRDFKISNLQKDKIMELIKINKHSYLFKTEVRNILNNSSSKENLEFNLENFLISNFKKELLDYKNTRIEKIKNFLVGQVKKENSTINILQIIDFLENYANINSN